MARASQLLEDTCPSIDFVDCNFGCPIDVVTQRGAGSALLLRPQKMEAIVRACSSVLSCPLTFKTRTGFHDANPVAHSLLPQAAAWGAAAVTLHGRSRQQRYSRLADWEYVGKCAAACARAGLPVIGNGDVYGWEDVEAAQAAGVATVMVARGALIKPWVFTEIKERRHWDISAGERLDMLKVRRCLDSVWPFS